VWCKDKGFWVVKMLGFQVKAGSLTFDEESKRKCGGKKSVGSGNRTEPRSIFSVKQIEHAERIDKTYAAAYTSSRDGSTIAQYSTPRLAGLLPKVEHLFVPSAPTYKR
jgi:hypothetical protein